MKKIYYEKQGRRYVPVAEYDNDFFDSFPKGHHLVSVYPGGRSRKYQIDPNYAAMIAAGHVAKDAICTAMFNASEAKPQKTPITPRQKAAWEELKASFGDEMFSLSFSSTADLAEAGIAAMQKEADKLMKHASVQNAFEQFMLVCQLAKDSEDA